MKPKVLVLTTGGTIGHRSQQDGVAVMDFDPQGLIASIGLPDVDLEFRSIFRKGSMDIVPGDWVVLAEAVAQAVALQPRGVVILHGTDTMHYTASALAFMLRDLGVPVVMTGSMIPGAIAAATRSQICATPSWWRPRRISPRSVSCSRRMRKERKASSSGVAEPGRCIPTRSTPLPASTSRRSGPSPARRSFDPGWRRVRARQGNFDWPRTSTGTQCSSN